MYERFTLDQLQGNGFFTRDVHICSSMSDSLPMIYSINPQLIDQFSISLHSKNLILGSWQLNTRDGYQISTPNVSGLKMLEMVHWWM